jgi:hypothetical protein
VLLPPQRLETLNTGLEPILMRALTRFRALLPPQVELVELVNDNLRVRARKHLEVAAQRLSVAWRSMGTATQIIVEMKDVLDDIVLDPAAEKLQGGLPRHYAWIVVTNNTCLQAGPSAPASASRQVDDRPAAPRLKLANPLTWWATTPRLGRGTQTKRHHAFVFSCPTAMHLELPPDASGSDVQHYLCGRLNHARPGR